MLQEFLKSEIKQSELINMIGPEVKVFIITNIIKPQLCM